MPYQNQIKLRTSVIAEGGGKLIDIFQPSAQTTKQYECIKFAQN
jgi:hypothetical protein